MITTDEKLIRSILEDPSVRDGYWGELRPDNVFLDNVVYFYYENVGLFPATFNDSQITIHAAIPKKNRGIKAVRAGIELAEDLRGAGWEVYVQVRKELKHGIRYVKMIGFTMIKELNEHYLYRYL
jgi:hypothetical protein